MKTAIIAITTVALTATLMQAKDKDFGVNVQNETLKVGENKVQVSIKSKTVPVRNAHVKLKVYHPDDTTKVYTSKSVNANSKHTFVVNLPAQGTYNYVMTFNKMGGVTHYRRGDFSF